jgi:predicted amidohydrolase YtcJ
MEEWMDLPADVVFLNGKVVTLDPQDRIASSVAVKGGHILAVGSDEEIRKLAGRGTRCVDLKRRTVLPGLIDAHTHMAWSTLIFKNYVDGRCPPNRSIADVMGKIRERAEQVPAGEWIPVQGSFFANFKFAEGRYPSREELDSAAPRHAAVFVATVHSAIVNTCALNTAKIGRDTPDPPGVKIERNPATGEPNGMIREWHGFLPLMNFTYEQIKRAIRDWAPDYWVKQGCTSAQTFADALEFRAYQELAAEGRLPVRIRANFMDIHLGPEPVIDSLVNLGIQPGVGNDWLRMGGAKIFLDGALMGLSAATHEPYLNMTDADYRGMLKFADFRKFEEMVRKAHGAGIQLCLHAIGDKAQDWALRALESVLAADARPHRHRIEHMGNLMTNRERICRAQALGVIPVTTVEWVFEEGDFIEHYLGPTRKAQSWPLRSMLDAGLRVANCSDTVGATPFSTNPFYSMWCAVTRQTYLGKRLIPEEAITVKEALRLYTTEAAYAGYEEDCKGSIESGKFADLIVIDRDILTVPDDQIKDIKVEMTVIDGRVVYKRDGTMFPESVLAA